MGDAIEQRATNLALAEELLDAEASYDETKDDERVILAQNAVCERLDLPLDHTEQGLTKWASEQIDRFVQTWKRTSIGNVSVHLGEPPDGNPYIRRYEANPTYVTGADRAAALRVFRDGGDAARWTFWHAPAGGGARRILSPDEIDWRGMGS